MDLGMEELKSSISNSVMQVSNQLVVRLRGMVTLCTFPCCQRWSLTCEGPRAGVSWLCCTGLRLPDSFSCLCSFCSCHVCAWLQVDLSLKLKLALAWAALASFSQLLGTFFFFFEFQNISSIHSPIVVVSTGFAFWV